jgi:adenylate cyclase
VLRRALSIASGLVLFAYVTTHLSNHALGLVSFAAMEAGLGWFLALWRQPFATAALYGALVGHVILGLASLYRRRHLRMPAWEATQIALGLAIPPLLASHVVGTRLAHELAGASDSYARVVLGLWVLAPQFGVGQLVLMLIAWTHGCLGLHFWLRLKPGYRRLVLPLFGCALLLPVLALLGFAQAAREVSALARDPDWVKQTLASPAREGARASVELARMRWTLIGGYLVAVGAVAGARVARHLARRRGATLRLTYPGQVIVVPVGLTVLEASRLAGIPHASVCGGRGRCSTCRVSVIGPPASLPAPGADELRVLRRAGVPSTVRLACQLRPVADITVTPLLPATATAADGLRGPDHQEAREREICVLFADLRGFTAIAERKLPYDVVFLLNRYFEAVGGAIQGAGGVANQFTGDGVMALFGADTSPDEACRRALAAAAAMVAAVEELSRALTAELPAPLRLGIGIHTGPAVVGRMGYGQGVSLTAVGDTVNVAARLEELTKTYECGLVVSDRVAERAGLDVTALPRHELALRNRGEPLTIRVIRDARLAAESLR